jgi:hypothetical protein
MKNSVDISFGSEYRVVGLWVDQTSIHLPPSYLCIYCTVPPICLCSSSPSCACPFSSICVYLLRPDLSNLPLLVISRPRICTCPHLLVPVSSDLSMLIRHSGTAVPPPPLSANLFALRSNPVDRHSLISSIHSSSLVHVKMCVFGIRIYGILQFASLLSVIRFKGLCHQIRIA